MRTYAAQHRTRREGRSPATVPRASSSGRHDRDTAEDLGAAQEYPVSLLRTVLRAYLGCGVVCGLGLRVKPIPDKKPHLGGLRRPGRGDRLPGLPDRAVRPGRSST